MGFVTIGQSPRNDIVPEMVAWVGQPIEDVQVGALDGLGDHAIAALAPVGAESRLVSRLADGSEVVMSRGQVHDRVGAILSTVDSQHLDAIVLLCTGQFPAVRLRTPFVSSQAAVDFGVAALARDARSLGVLVPNEVQAREIERRGWSVGDADEDGQHGFGPRVKATHVTPYGRDGAVREEFEKAARALVDTDLIVMHCMGYDERMLAWVRQAAGRPTVLARRFVGSALRQLL